MHFYICGVNLHGKPRSSLPFCWF